MPNKCPILLNLLVSSYHVHYFHISYFLKFWLHWVFVALVRLSLVESKWRGWRGYCLLVYGLLTAGASLVKLHKL